MSTIPDRGQRLQALDPSASFIVQAPAGSGKTELLTQRFLRLLGRVGKPEEIVAITFTRKAAAEMRQRILGALEMATGEAPAEVHRRETWDLAREALAQDASEQWDLRLNPNRLRIQTFDSLCASLARQLPLLSEIGASAHTREDADTLYRDAARATLARLDDPELRKPLATLLSHLDNRLGQLEDLLVQMLGKRDQWLPHLFETARIDRLERSLRHLIEEQLRQLKAHFPRDPMNELVQLADFAAQHLPQDKRDDPRLTGLLRWQERHAPPEPSWDELQLWQGLARLLLTDKGTLRLTVNKNLGFPANEKQVKQRFKDLVDTLQGNAVLTDALHATRRLPADSFDADQEAVLLALQEVLLDATAQLELVFQEAAELDFIEVQLRALRALGTTEDPGELALLLDYRIQHLLVDEFQDTSLGQYRLLESLTAGWQADDGRSLFVVGDPMQSIYRFRKAEVSLFLRAFAEGFPNVPLTPLRLEMNFRSQGGVVEWVNETFRGVFPGDTDILLGAMPYASSTPFHPRLEGEAVVIHPAAQRNGQAQAAEIVELIRQRQSSDPEGSIAVLGRARSHLREIAAGLQQAGIHYQAVKVDPLASRPTVQDLHNLTRALLHPADRLSWLALLRSPLVGMDVADLAALCEANPALPVWSLLHSEAKLQSLTADGRLRAQRLTRVLRDDFPSRRRGPLRDRVEGLWLSLGGAEVGDIQDAGAYLDLLARYSVNNTIEDFGVLEQALAQLFAPPDNQADERLQLMTMHQAKGLEFDTVILPGLGRRPPVDANELLYWLELPEPHEDASLVMAPIKATHQEVEPISGFVRWLNRSKQELEDVRLLYVAATRAKKQLHLFGHIRFNKKEEASPEAGSLLQRLWPALASHFETLASPPDANAADEVWQAGPRREYRIGNDEQHTESTTHGSPPPQAPTPAPKRIDFAWTGDTARHVGTLTHRYLERIARDGLPHWPLDRIQQHSGPIQAGLATLGVAPEQQVYASEKVMEALTRTLQHDIGQWILSAHEQADCELPLTCLDDRDEPRQYAIDRTFVADGVRWIVDYKTSEADSISLDAFLDGEVERYREQLDNYAAILALLEQRPTRLALYFPLLQAWRSWDATNSG